MPGTIAEHPNWRRRTPREAHAMLDEPAAAARLAIIDQQRHR
jgi:4-alpha-glucanotransferase